MPIPKVPIKYIAPVIKSTADKEIVSNMMNRAISYKQSQEYKDLVDRSIFDAHLKGFNFPSEIFYTDLTATFSNWLSKPQNNKNDMLKHN